MPLMVVAGCGLERDRAGILEGLGLPLALAMDLGVAAVIEHVSQLCRFGPGGSQGDVGKAARGPGPCQRPAA